MKATRQAEEDALRVLRLLDCALPKREKDELEARLEKILEGRDPYRRDQEGYEPCRSLPFPLTLREKLLGVKSRKQK